MKTTLIRVGGRLAAAGLAATCSAALFTVFSRAPEIGGNPLAMVAIGAVCVIAPLMVLVSPLKKGGTK